MELQVREACRERATPSLAGRLEGRVTAARRSRKRDRTLARLRTAIAQGLEARGYEKLRIADIAAFAGTSTAGYYVYFRNKSDGARQILRPFLRALLCRPIDFHGLASRDAALRRVLLEMLGALRTHAGLLTALEEFGAAEPSWGRLVERCFRTWCRRVVLRLNRLDPARKVSHAAACETADMFSILMLGAAWRIRHGLGDAEIEPLADRMAALWLCTLYPVGSRTTW